jgi:hypothetical protein
MVASDANPGVRERVDTVRRIISLVLIVVSCSAVRKSLF